MHPWLARLKHDLVKRALWPARDLSELLHAEKDPAPAELQALRDGLFSLRDEEGNPCDARTLWARMLESVPPLNQAALDSFAAGVDSAMNVVGHATAPGEKPSRGVLKLAVDAVLVLERLFDALLP